MLEIILKVFENIKLNFKCRYYRAVLDYFVNKYTKEK